MFAPQPKPRPKLLEKRDAAADLDREDRRQRAICHTRSGGQCEVVEWLGGTVARCTRRATENHHLIGGIGRRNVGRSLLAAHRIDICERCHREINGAVLKAFGPAREYAASVMFERVR